jgi:hypothetical protein
LLAALAKLLARFRSRLLLPLRLFGRAGMLGPVCVPPGRGGGSSSVFFDIGSRMDDGSAAIEVEVESLSAGFVWLAIPIGAGLSESLKPVSGSSGSGGLDADDASAKCGPTSVPSVTTAAPPGNMFTTRNTP